MESQGDDDLTSLGYRTDSRCHVCSAPDRDVPNGWAVRNLVDELLLVPKTYAAILRLIEPLMASWPDDARISRHSLMRHSRNHLAWEQAAIRQIAERHAQETGKVDEAAGWMLSTEVVLRAVQQRGFEGLASGEVTPSIKDMLTASAALREIEREAEGQFSTAELLCQLDTVIQIIREIVPPELHEAIADRIDREQRKSLPSPPPPSDPAWDDVMAEMGAEGLK
jgi:hypothetical protein